MQYGFLLQSFGQGGICVIDVLKDLPFIVALWRFLSVHWMAGYVYYPQSLCILVLSAAFNRFHAVLRSWCFAEEVLITISV